MINPNNNNSDPLVNNGNQLVVRYALGNNINVLNVSAYDASGNQISSNTVTLNGLLNKDLSESNFVPVQDAVNAVNGQLLIGFYGVYTVTSNNGQYTAQPITYLGGANSCQAPGVRKRRSSPRHGAGVRRNEPQRDCFAKRYLRGPRGHHLRANGDEHGPLLQRRDLGFNFHEHHLHRHGPA